MTGLSYFVLAYLLSFLIFAGYGAFLWVSGRRLQARAAARRPRRTA